MNITIFGMGYVGIVSAACLLRDGHTVTGVDPNEAKVRDLNAGRTPIQEPGVAELLAAGHASGRLTATAVTPPGLGNCDMAWICVGTPSRPDGGVNTQQVERCIREIGTALREARTRPLLVARSTVPPGTVRNCLIPALEQTSGLRVGRDLHVVFHPEFLREGCAVDDFDHPPKIVVGEAHPGAADPLLKLYERYTAPRFRVGLEVAEMVKYSDNLFHAVKVVFANEIGALARAVGADARQVAEIFCSDTKLNINPYYLRPGFAFGGSCLPKDLRAMLRLAQQQSIRVPLFEATAESNRVRIEELVERVLSYRPARVGMVGLAFKPRTDDMRESPYVAVAKRLIGEGIELRIYDPGVDTRRLLGSNQAAVQTALGHLERLLVASLDEFAQCELILVNHPTVTAECVTGWLKSGLRVIDLVGIPGLGPPASPGYEGIAW
ncbi:MAG TPA: nucleotide sugar dehydrogenase [Phycisphaerae bacterium]|nr:nucleotide sugar dehydrogenase [Phycisphaerae bacterium]HPC22821.1 nucleotide sugar dehydrogenase [Phycisphaerae bacterium]